MWHGYIFEIWSLNLGQTRVLWGSLYSHPHFHQKNVIWIHFWDLITEPWPNQSCLGQSLESSSLFLKNFLWYWCIFEIWYLNPDQTSSLGQSLQSSSLSPDRILWYWYIFEIWYLNPDQTRVLWGGLYSHRHFHQKKCDMDTFLRFDHWTLTKPEFSGAFTVILTFTRKKCDMDTFLRFDTWTLTKPEFSGAVFTVIAPFTRNKFVILIFFEDLITEPWPNPEKKVWYWYIYWIWQLNLDQTRVLWGSLYSHRHFHQIEYCDIDIFVRFDKWTLTKPEFSGAVFTVFVAFTRKFCVFLIFLRFDHWTLTKPEFSGAVFTVIVTFTRKSLVILIYLWILITEPWPNQGSLGQSLQSSSLSPEKFVILIHFWDLITEPWPNQSFLGQSLQHPHFHQRKSCDIDTFIGFDNWTLTKPEFSGAFTVIVTFTRKNVIWIHFWDLITEPWPNQSSLGQSLESSSLSPEKKCDIDVVLRFDTWTLTKPEFSGPIFTVIVTFTRNKFVILIFFKI